MNLMAAGLLFATLNPLYINPESGCFYSNTNISYCEIREDTGTFRECTWNAFTGRGFCSQELIYHA